MRIAFIGKGGSGKTTLAASFAQFLAREREVLLIDADVNAHVHECFQLVPKHCIGDKIEEIATLLKGTRSDLGDAPMIGTTPPAKGSVFIAPKGTDPFLASYAVQKGNLHLLTVGTYQEEDIGVNCYHGKLGAAELVLHHMHDTKEGTVIMDATAGVDLLGTSLFMAFDYILFVVEPTKKSVDVYKTFVSKIDTSITVLAIGNKIRSDKDKEFLESQGLKPICHIPFHDSLRQFEQGDTTAFAAFVDHNSPHLEEIQKQVPRVSRDWKQYYTRLAQLHKNMSASWYDAYYDIKLSEQFDSSFDFLEGMG